MKHLTIGLLCSLVAANCSAGIVEDSGVKGGIVVQLGVESGQALTELLASDAYLVHALDRDAAKVDKAREDLRDQGLYGKISVDQFVGTKLPYADNLVNLLIDSNGTWEVASDEVNRVLVPGGVAIIGGKKTVKPWPADMGTWTHYLHGPDNNAVVNDGIVAAPRSIQWVADPMWSRSHEQMASVSAAVTDAGRIFYIEDIAPRVSIRYMPDWKLTCRDAFNGTLLWRRDIGQWSDHLRHFRAGPVHLTRRLVVDGDKLYATMAIDAPVSVLDAVTGETIRVIEGTERTDEITIDEGIAYLVVGTSEKNRRGADDSFYERGEPKATDYRFITAIDLSSDKVLWKKNFSGSKYVLPLSMTVRGGSVYYQNLQGVGRLDAKTGNELWLTPRETVARRMSFSAPTVVATDDVLLVADRNPSRRTSAAQPEEKTGKNPRKKKGDSSVPPATTDVEWGIHGWNINGVPRGNPSTLIAYSVEDGKELWRMNASEIYNAPVDVFVIDDIVYVSRGWSGYDLRTGEQKIAMSPGARVAMAHHRCYRNKASVNYIFTGRDGIEVLDVKEGWQGNNSWIRGTCQYGIMPANGLLYTPPNACGCSTQVQLQGFFAASPRRDVSGAKLQARERLQKGPAFGQVGNSHSEISDSSWPMFRANARRSGSVETQIRADLKKAWSAKITDLQSKLTRSQLTQAVVAGGTVYIAVRDAHTVHALDANSGKEKWTYTTGGRIDSAPTYHKGMLICGSADGCVYCLRASDGVLMWKFKAAPADMLVSVFGQLESAWPVHGSVLVRDDELVLTAGRSTYLDDGLRFYRLNPVTGQVLAEKTIAHIDPETDKQTGIEPFKEAGARTGFNIEGVTTDIMSSDDGMVYLKYMGFDKDGNEIKENKADHLFSMTNMLAEEWFVRTYWFYGHEFGGGWGGWSYAGRFPSGRIMAFDDDGIFGYGRTVIGSGPTGHKADQYHLYKNDGWSDGESPIVRAMVKASDKIVVAGPEDLRKKSSRLLAYENEADALASFKGEKGVVMRVVSAADGTVLSEQSIDAVPAFDGMSAADGAVFIALKNGELQCWK